jgi:NAD(P)-dependent dehydrogenase (short-subunit alcohol dehydrogenase family)
VATQSPSRVAFVTGAASGIGLAVAEHLVAEGWRVAAADRDAGQLAVVAERHPDRAELLTLLLDVTDEAAVEAAMTLATDALGPITGVVNSAGIAADVPALDTPVDLYRRILDVNVIGSFIVARTAARRMIARARPGEPAGAIVNIASVSGLRGGKGRVAYGSSKAAVILQTQVLANDLAPHGIRCNAIAPGPIETPLIKALHTAEDRAVWSRFVPMNRYGRPEDIAHAAAFLLDETSAAFITGAVLAVDGGFSGAGVIVR